MKKINVFSSLGLASVLLFSTYAQAFNTESKFALPLSASFGLGTLESSDLDLKSRTMTSTSFEALPSYRVGRWLFGLHLDYRIQSQLTSLSDAEGTNLKGKGYLFGLGARYNFSDRLFTQGSVDFFGMYDFEKDTSASEDDELKSPLSLRVKAGYVLLPQIPNLTFDVDLQYLTWSKIHIAGNDKSATFNQLMASVGVTYEFDFGKRSMTSVPTQSPAEEKPVPVAQSTQIEHIEGIKKVGQSFVLNVSGASFASGSAELSEDAKAQFAQAAEAIAKSNASVRVEGHTDSSGKLESNKTLSQARAESVRTFLVEHGVNAEKVSAQGFGPSKPIADNKTKEGRAKNRRVEIYIDGVAQ